MRSGLVIELYLGRLSGEGVQAREDRMDDAIDAYAKLINRRLKIEPKYKGHVWSAVADMVQRVREEIGRSKKGGTISATRLDPDQVIVRGDWRYSSEKLAKVVKGGWDLVPILAGTNGNVYWVLDGHHRLRAYQMAKKPVPALVGQLMDGPEKTIYLTIGKPRRDMTAMNPETNPESTKKRKKRKAKKKEETKGYRDWIAVHAQMRTSAGETKGPGGKSKAQRSKEAARGKVKHDAENPYMGDAVSRAKERKLQAAARKRKTPPPLPASARKKVSKKKRVSNPTFTRSRVEPWKLTETQREQLSEAARGELREYLSVLNDLGRSTLYNIVYKKLYPKGADVEETLRWASGRGFISLPASGGVNITPKGVLAGEILEEMRLEKLGRRGNPKKKATKKNPAPPPLYRPEARTIVDSPPLYEEHEYEDEVGHAAWVAEQSDIHDYHSWFGDTLGWKRMQRDFDRRLKSAKLASSKRRNPKKKASKKKVAKRAVSASARNPKSQWTLAHRLLLTRMYKRPVSEALPAQFIRALKDLQNEGLATIGHISEPYQDPEAGPDEGEVLLWDVNAKITPLGKEFVSQTGMMQAQSKLQSRAIQGMMAEKKGRALKVPTRNPKAKKKVTKKKVAKRKGPTALSLIANCQRKWESYCVRPSKKRLQIVLDHLEKMKASKAKSVKSERSRCLRAANLEAKRLKMK